MNLHGLHNTELVNHMVQTLHYKQLRETNIVQDTHKLNIFFLFRWVEKGNEKKRGKGTKV